MPYGILIIVIRNTEIINLFYFVGLYEETDRNNIWNMYMRL
jgi:hypothetical protein